MKARALVAIAALILAGCSPARKEAPASPVLATVNGSPITVSQFNDKLKLLSLGFSNISADNSSGADAKFDMLSQVIEEELYLQEARRLSIAATGPEVDAAMKKVMADYPGRSFEKALEQAGLDLRQYRAEQDRKVTVEKLIESEVYSKVRTDSAQARDYFEKHKQEFYRPARVRARQIVVDNRRDAEDILKELRKGANFAALARARSFSPDSAVGGDLGYFSRGEMPPEFERAVFGMKPGRISGIVRTPYGYHIFKVEGVLKAEKPTFQEAEPEVRRRLARELGEDAFDKWQDNLKAKAKIEVNFEVLNRL